MNEMSKMEDIGTDAKIDLNEIVSVFTSKYEERMYVQKDAITTAIKTTRDSIADLAIEVTKSIDGSNLTGKHPLLSDLTEVTRMFNVDTSKVVIKFSVRLGSEERYFKFYKEFNVNKKFITKHNKLAGELSKLSGELNATMTNLRDIGRKERQVRARIVEQKLEQSGLEHLLKDKTLQKLIEG